jgi:acetyl esterase/lipase
MPSNEFKAGLEDVTFKSQGSTLLGGFYLGAGVGPRPTAVLLHGVPGVEKNLDIAYALRDKGWNCLYFHYRGSWGSEGSYSFSGAYDDVAAAADWVLKQPSVDRERLAIVGNSIGGYLAFAASASDSRIKATVSISPLVDPTTVAISDEIFDEFAVMLKGVSAEELKAQWDALPSIQTMSAALRSRAILLITADQDELFPPSHYESLTAAVKSIDWRRISNADHVFSTCRTQLVKTTVGWLENIFREKKAE